MPFPTVKSSPYGRKRQKSRARFMLWSAAFWKLLCERAQLDLRLHGINSVSPECIEMISEMNFLLYGKRQ